ncbi:MAG: DMT family transporter [Prevotella sp.]|nr:MAG: DMT family transporter [Prevotella sp.]
MLKMNFTSTVKGYVTGMLSGATWGMDTVLLGLAMTMLPFTENPILLIGGTIVCSMLHDVFAAFWMLIIMGGRGRLKELGRAIRSRDGRFCILGALLGGPLAMTFYLLAISKGGAALTATVTACYPLLGSAMAVRILKEKMSLRGWVGLLICVLGIAYIGYVPSDNSNIDVIGGIGFALIAAIGWASEAVVCGYGMKSGKVDPQMALLIRELTSGLAYTLIVTPLLIGGYANVVNGVSAIFSYGLCWITLVLTALLGMVSFLCWYTSINSIGASRALCLNVTYSFWAVIFGLFILGGEFSFNVVIGSIVIVLGVIVATVVSKPKCSAA